MNNTGNISLKMGITQRGSAWQGMAGQWLNHVLRDAQGRAQLRRLLEQHELPVIKFQGELATHQTHRLATAGTEVRRRC